MRHVLFFMGSYLLILLVTDPIGTVHHVQTIIDAVRGLQW